jgi:hypothetical protein
MLISVLPFARKYPCKRKFWLLQGNVHGNKIYEKMARNFVVKKGIRIYTLPIITSQLHCFQLRTTLNGKDFKFFSHGLCTEKQNILLQHMHKKYFFILTNKCGNKF